MKRRTEHVARTRETNLREFWLEDFKRRDHFEDLSEDERLVLQ
jgi:hypothetical protein